jgi:hypothetical protein
VLRQIDSCSCSGVRHTDNTPMNILFSVVRHYRTELLNLDQGPALFRFFRDNVRSAIELDRNRSGSTRHC